MQEDHGHLWDWFWDLSSSRSIGFNGPNPISVTDIANWAALTGTIVRREEVGIIRAMDAAYISAVAEEHATETGKE
ncbi:hypothetical protein C5748_18420 [Phyllobacterium phragmitis]|uniref:Uncharacterized protein n=1 Tax=Phyllobacterium phragmitis TaxID=2670329 RepID=A0A2S9INQ5_9HYPH|nr:hypothetical protein C5748_18420 [Phyllobacterium phragmitis]